MEIAELNDGEGANIYSNKGVITVWFKKCKVGFSGNWRKLSDMSEVLSYVDKIINPQPKVAQALDNEPKTPCQAMAEAQGIGTQACINHIQRKIEFIEKNNPSNQVLTILKAICKELQQYI
mgnify:CR=1 FL=1